MKLRPGRKNPRNLYLQVGDVPDDADPCLGLMIDTDTAALLGEGLTSAWHLNEIKISVEIREDKT